MSWVDGLVSIFQPVGADPHQEEFAEQMRCIEIANNSPRVVEIEAEIKKLNTTWKPTGYYRPDEIAAVLAKLDPAAREAAAVVTGAPDSTRNAESQKREATRELFEKVIVTSEWYAKALTNARSEGSNIIDAPGLKDFVIAGLQSIANGFVTAAMLQCQQSWAQSLLDKAYRLIMGVVDFVATIGGIIVDVADKVYKAGRGAFSLLGTIAKVAPYVAVGLGGYLAFVMGRAGYRRLVTKAEGPINWSVFKRKPKQIAGARGRRYKPTRNRRGRTWR
jgi:hypothetical protein